jgi:tetratricopeptide (TPR) repeat protein
MDDRASDIDGRLFHAKVLVELGELHDAEENVAEILEENPDDLNALSLLAKIKHIKGDLSSVVGCWAQIYARSSHNETALMQLKAILHLARDPERGAGEFLALGPFELARKPSAQLALEEAFRLFLSRRPDEARTRCADLSAKTQHKDREVYKLAVLANAWIAELSGDYEVACEVLETLGRGRGFETDTDRVLSLVRVYERLGTRDKLEAAVNICRYLELRFEKLSMLSRLSALYRRLGQQELAREYEARYLVAFRRRMHRPTFADVLQVASRSYLPLQRLLTIQFSSVDVPNDGSPRERALCAALTGDMGHARALFLESTDLLDCKYLADLYALEGDHERAVRLYLEALRNDPDELRVVGWLLDHFARTEARAIGDYFRQIEVALRTREALSIAIRRAPLRPSLWRHLATLAQLRGELEEAARCEERAAALLEAAHRKRGPVGRMFAAAVYHLVVKAKGLIHEVWAGRQPAPPGQGGWLPTENILGNLTSEMKEGVSNTFLAVREYARSKLPHLTADILDYNYTFKVTKEDEPSGGLSAGLPTALAFLSVFLQRPIPQDTAATGCVVADSHEVLTLRGVGDAEYKVKGAYHRNLRMLILPLANRTGLEANGQVPFEITDEIVRYAANLDDAVKLVFGEDIFIAVR